jgi:Domain of unknown function (DUF4189)
MKSLLILLAAIMPFVAQAHSALVIAQPSDIANDGLAVGDGFNYASVQEAEQGAMTRCLNQYNNGGTHRNSTCTVVAHFDHQWLSVAMDPADGTPGFGWGIAATADEAVSQAMDNCRRTAAGRGNYCTISFTHFDSSPSN